MATISNTPRPGYVWDSTDNVWYPIGVGGHSHPDYITQATAISPTTVDAKGDLLVGSAADTISRLAVGADGSSIVADSATSSGLRWQGNYSAGKNAIINGAFNVWQRGTTQALTNGVVAYLADRYQVSCSFTAGTSSVSQQTFTPGTAPVAGYEGTYYQRITCGSTSSYFDWTQKIEDVRTFAGQTVTFSFWAKASAATDAVMLVRQNFGSGGSANVNASSAIALTTSWQRFTFTTTLGAMTGKTIGTNSYLFAVLYSSGAVASGLTVDSWGWQLEASNTATAFQTATGTLQGELAACQRYYYRTEGSSGNSVYGTGTAANTTAAYMFIPFQTKMRIAPTVLDYSILALSDGATWTAITSATLTFNSAGNGGAITANVASGLAQFRPYILTANGNSAGYIGFGAEL